MWTPRNRKRYDRSLLRYPSDLTDDEWALIAPLIPPAKPGEQHKEARAAYLAAMDVPGEDREIRAAEDACQQAEHDVFYELFATAPTTTAGMAALFEHLASPRWEGDGDSIIQSVAEDWESDPKAGAKWATLMAEAFRKMAATA